MLDIPEEHGNISDDTIKGIYLTEEIEQEHLEPLIELPPRRSGIERQPTTRYSTIEHVMLGDGKELETYLEVVLHE